MDPQSLANYASPAGIAAAILAAFGYLAPVVGVTGGIVALTYYVLAIMQMPLVQTWWARRKESHRKAYIQKLEITHATLVQELIRLGAFPSAKITLQHHPDQAETTERVELGDASKRRD